MKKNHIFRIEEITKKKKEVNYMSNVKEVIIHLIAGLLKNS